VHVSTDGGATWQRISDALPQHLWVSRVRASAHDTATVYVSLNGYRWDDFSPYLYKSTDYGATWQRLGADLPDEPINVVLEDPANPKLLYVGTDHGLYISLDGGASFMAMMGDLPYAPVHDLVVQPRDKDLVVGTHGRSLFVANVEHVQQLTDSLLQQPVHVFAIAPVTFRENWGKRRSPWREPTEPEMEIAYFLGQAGQATIHIKTQDGTVLQTLHDDAEHGLNYLKYDLGIDSDKILLYQKLLQEQQLKAGKAGTIKLKPADTGKVYLHPGKYVVQVYFNGEKAEQTLEVKAPKKRKRGRNN